MVVELNFKFVTIVMSHCVFCMQICDFRLKVYAVIVFENARARVAACTGNLSIQLPSGNTVAAAAAARPKRRLSGVSSPSKIQHWALKEHSSWMAAANKNQLIVMIFNMNNYGFYPNVCKLV
ncbi:hypothetical protein ACFX1X_023687 [Malus domestica]